MFCPKCGQQSSDEVRFCPRCGLSLAGLPAYMAGDASALARPAAPMTPERAARRRGMRRGAKVMFLSAVLFPIFFGFALIIDHPAPLLAPLAVFLAGLMLVVYSLLFAEDPLPGALREAARRDLNAGAERPALGAQQFVPAPLFNQQRANTAEIVQPPSVTEHTTKLLDKDS